MRHFLNDGRHNFVDENNVLVGFSYGDYCARGGWYVAEKPAADGDLMEAGDDGDFSDWEGFVFDPDYFVELDDPTGFLLDEGGCVAFRLVRGEEVKYLHLYNCHTGYYGRGFSVFINGERVRRGGL